MGSIASRTACERNHITTRNVLIYRVKTKCRQGSDLAIADFDRAIEVQPDYAEAYSNRGEAYEDKGDYERAIADYGRAIELQPDVAEAARNLRRLRKLV